MDAKVIVRREDAVLRITMNRPAKKNALDREMYEAMVTALQMADSDAGVRVVLLEGAGGAFSAGNDLEDFRSALDRPEDFPALRFVRALAACRTPLVAAVEGDAVGVGATMLFHCDLVYAAPNARFKMPFVDLGVVPEAGSTLLIPSRVGMAKAAQFLLLCESFGAEEAFRLGIVNALVSADDLEGVALAAAQALARKPAEALAATRKLLRGDPSALAARIEEEGEFFAKLVGSPATRARIDAFFASKAEKAEG